LKITAKTLFIFKGSERESDENYEGESGDDSIVFSGDEAELPDNDELKEELGQIYL
jgi:hypothetical protein